jgi:membrane fusion protein, heavy metal efflux system
VLKVMVTVGDRVSEGKPLLLLDSPDVDTDVSNFRQAVAKVAGAKSAVAKADADASREQDLFARGAVAQKDVLSAQAQLAQAKSDLAQANASEEEARRKLRVFGIQEEGDNNIFIRAPVSGKVLDLSVTAGEYRNDTSAPVMTIANLSSVYMSADVPETSIRFMHLGQPVIITFDAYPDQQFTGRVAHIGDTVDPNTRTIKVRASLPNGDEKFRPDMFGQLQIESPPQQMLTVPVEAIVQTANGPTVYRQAGVGHFEPVNVKLGNRVANRIAVASGLRPSDQVVADGSMLIGSSVH